MPSLLWALLLAWGGFAFGEASRPAAPSAPRASLAPAPGPSHLAQDPLTRRIRTRQLSQPNGGITAVVRIASGQTIELKVTDLGLEPPPVGRLGAKKALAPLKPSKGLAAQRRSRAARPVRRARRQLRTLQGREQLRTWGGPR